MPIPVRQKNSTRIENLVIQITDDGSRTLFWENTDDGFHSGCGALTETRHVYLKNSGVSERLNSQMPTSVLEIGVGTGMGLLVTLDLAVELNAPLRYVGVENDWIHSDVLRALRPHDWVTRKSVADDYLRFRQRAEPTETVHRWTVTNSQSVDVITEDLLEWNCDSNEPFDAIYFDPFAPASNPKLWTAEVFHRMHGLLNDHGKLVTYCVKRSVRDALEESGFEVDRVPGPVKGKREVLIATKDFQ